MRLLNSFGRALLFSAAVIAAPPASQSSADQPAAKPAASQPAATSDATPPSTAPDPDDLRAVYDESDAERRIRAALDRPLNANYLDTQLGDVIVDLHDKFDIPIYLDYQALAAEGKGSETQITQNFEGTTLRNALQLTLWPLDLTFAVRLDNLLITTKSAAERYTTARIYPVHDLVVAANDPTASHADLESLIELVEATIVPESWRSAGGAQGEIRGYNGPGILALVVTQTDDVHERIADLLRNLRLARDPKLREAQSKGTTVRLAPFTNGFADPLVPPHALPGDKGVEPPEKTVHLKAWLDSINHTACTLYLRLAGGERRGKNVAFSPLGLHTATSCIYAGARGRTAEAMAAALHLPPAAELPAPARQLTDWLGGNQAVRGYRIDSRTRAYFQSGELLKADYVARLTGDFGATLQMLDFKNNNRTAVVSRLLDYARRDAASDIVPAGLFDEVDADTRFAVLNTVTFRGRWAEPFNPHFTLRETFHGPSGELKVQMMHDLTTVGYREMDDLQIVGKEYEGLPGVARAVFYIVLPKPGSEALAACENRLKPETLKRWFEDLPETLVELHLPKFEFDNILDLKPALTDVGMKSAFGPIDGEAPDFSDINGRRDLMLQAIHQNAKIKVDEVETIATAQTAGQGGLGGTPPALEPPPLVRCDRPFLFFIRDEASGALLFTGRVTEPDNDPNAVVAPPLPRAQVQGGGYF